MEDETRHEAQLAAMIHEEKLSYISSMVLGLNDALVELMDTLAESCTEAEYQRLEEIFVNCSRYELGFWEMAWTLER